VWQTLGSRTILLLASVAFLDYFVGYTVYFWLPTILKRQSGLSDARVGLLGAVPYIAAFAAMLINGWHSDRRRERRWHTAVPLFLAAAALLGLVTLPASTPLTVVLLTLVTLATAAFLVTFWAIPTEILSESTAAAAVGLINAVGSVAGFAGPYAFGYLLTRTGSWSSGLALMMVSALAGGALILGIPKRDRRPEAATEM
jgi:cyanate permease